MSSNDTGVDAGAEDPFSDFKLYRYTPSLVGAIIVAVAFAVLTILHIWRMFKVRSWYFTPFVIGGSFEVIGYVGRILSHSDPDRLSSYIMQSILILVAPALYAASIYMILGRLVATLRAEHLSVVPPRWMTRIFVAGDVLSFLLQSGGGGLLAKADTPAQVDVGENVILGGLWAQIIIFGFFVATAGLFHWRIARMPTERAMSGGIPWQKDLLVMYGVSLLILVRNAFRVVEYLQGNDGYLISHEVFLYIFDAVLMLLVMAVFLWHYVGHLEGKKKKKAGRELLESVELGEVTDGRYERAKMRH